MRKIKQLSSADRSDLLEFVSFASARLTGSDQVLEVDTNLEKFGVLLEKLPGNAGVNPTFDGRMNDLSKSAFWLALHDKREGLICVMATRVFVAERYFDLIRDGTMWYPEPYLHRIPVVTDQPGPSGIVSQSGGLWVHPDRRGEGFSRSIPRLLSALSVLVWESDYHTGVIFAELVKKGMPSNYGVSKTTLCVQGYFPPAGKVGGLFCVETPRADLVARSKSDLNIFLRNRRGDVGHTPGVVHQGDENAPISHALINKLCLDLGALSMS